VPVPLEQDADVKKWRRLYEGSSEWLDRFENGLYPAIFRRLSAAIESDLAHRRFTSVIEVGCGTGLHLAFVRHAFDRYILCDRSTEHLAAARARLSLRTDVEYYMPGGDELDYADGTFDRLLSVGTLEHIPNAWDVVQEWGRVVRPGGIMDIVVPTEGGMLWRFGRHWTTRRKALRDDNIDYDFLIATEHVNTAYHLMSIVRHYFPQVQTRQWPFRIGGIDLNLFTHMRVTVR
jgi:SAM-dependent methyltransferase